MKQKLAEQEEEKRVWEEEQKEKEAGVEEGEEFVPDEKQWKEIKAAEYLT